MERFKTAVTKLPKIIHIWSLVLIVQSLIIVFATVQYIFEFKLSPLEQEYVSIFKQGFMFGVPTYQFMAVFMMVYLASAIGMRYMKKWSYLVFLCLFLISLITEGVTIESLFDIQSIVMITTLLIGFKYRMQLT